MDIRIKTIIQRYTENSQLHPFMVLLDNAVHQAKVVLDAGCGTGHYFQYDYKKSVKIMAGVDYLWEELTENDKVHFAAAADLEKLPFAEQSFDLIFSHNVVEHLKHPEIVMAEFARILKPRGRVVIQTPNNFHYFTLAGHLIPHSFQRYIAKKYFKTPGDIFKTYYRCNSIPRIKSLASSTCLKPILFRLYEPPPLHLVFSPIFFYPAFVYEQAVNRFAFLSPFRAQLMAVLEKG